METLYLPVPDAERERNKRIVIFSYGAIAIVTIGLLVLNVTLIILDRTSTEYRDDHVNNTNSASESANRVNLSSTNWVENETRGKGVLTSSLAHGAIPRHTKCPPGQRRKADGSCGKEFMECKGNKRDRKKCKEDKLAKKDKVKKPPKKGKGQQVQDKKSKSA